LDCVTYTMFPTQPIWAPAPRSVGSGARSLQTCVAVDVGRPVVHACAQHAPLVQFVLGRSARTGALVGVVATLRAPGADADCGLAGAAASICAKANKRR
jgi:hypothetical protein